VSSYIVVAHGCRFASELQILRQGRLFIITIGSMSCLESTKWFNTEDVREALSTLKIRY